MADKKDRPPLGTGMAEKAARDIERQYSQTERRISKIFGKADKDPKRDKPQGKADKG